MRFFLLFLAISTSLMADQKFSLEGICKSFATASDQKDCKSFLAKGYLITNEMSELCASINLANLAFECAKSSANRFFSASAVKACGNFFYDDDKLNCANAIAFKEFPGDIYEKCGQAGQGNVDKCLKRLTFRWLDENKD